MDSGNEKYPEVYFCIDQKSFYASVECVLRGLDPMTALLVVADAERSKNTICLAVSVGCKKKGIKNRCRLGDVRPNMGVIVAPPQMQLYIDCAAEIHGVFPAVDVLYRRIVRQGFAIRQIGLSCPVHPDTGAYQLNMFEDTQKQLQGKALQETLLGIRSKYGKNAILKGINYDPSATGRERNMQIGGHRSGSESSQGTHAQK